MTTNQQMFLYAVEEMSVTRAAARAYVTQQCLSDHIRRLEESYGVKLFDRSPRLKLTQAGEILYRALRQIQVIEHGVQQEFSGEREAAHGTVTLGIHGVRARQMLPALFAAYRAQYPGIRLSVVLDETRRLVPQLLEGKIDLFLGVDCPPHPQLRKERLLEEPIYLLAAEELLQGRLFGWNSARTELRPEELSGLPLTGNPAVSTAAQAVERFLAEQDILMDTVCSVGDYHTQLTLCRLRQAVAFCPESFLGEVFASNQTASQEERVRVLRVSGLDNRLRVELVTHSSHYQPQYTAAFQRMMREQYLARMEEIRGELK
ncbi:MAG: LysR family transcriptional regulator [Lawsonibacter sp.]|nr:LysR family transcriptional regulator [Lawsonibacter sp.]